MPACRSSSKSTRKMNLISVFNKSSPRAYTGSELDVLGVHGKLVKCVVYLSRKKGILGVNGFMQASCKNGIH
jgi:hypothetical protein